MVHFITIPKCQGEQQKRILKKAIKDARDRLFDEDAGCIVCGMDSGFVDVLFQEETDHYFSKAPEGKERVAIVTICPWHRVDNLDTRQDIEKKLVSAWQ